MAKIFISLFIKFYLIPSYSCTHPVPLYVRNWNCFLEYTRFEFFFLCIETLEIFSWRLHGRSFRWVHHSLLFLSFRLAVLCLIAKHLRNLKHLRVNINPGISHYDLLFKYLYTVSGIRNC